MFLLSKENEILERLREGLELGEVEVPEHQRTLPSGQVITVRRYTREGRGARPEGGSGRHIPPTQRGRSVKMSETARIYKILRRRMKRLEDNLSAEELENHDVYQEMRRKADVALTMFRIEKEAMEEFQERRYDEEGNRLPARESARAAVERNRQEAEAEILDYAGDGGEDEDDEWYGVQSEYWDNYVSEYSIRTKNILNAIYNNGDVIDRAKEWKRQGKIVEYSVGGAESLLTRKLADEYDDLAYWGGYAHEAVLYKPQNLTREQSELLAMIHERGYIVRQRVHRALGAPVLQFDNPETGHVYEVKLHSSVSTGFSANLEFLQSTVVQHIAGDYVLKRLHRMRELSSGGAWGLEDVFRDMLEKHLRDCHHHMDYDKDRCHDPGIEHSRGSHETERGGSDEMQRFHEAEQMRRQIEDELDAVLADVDDEVERETTLPETDVEDVGDVEGVDDNFQPDVRQRTYLGRELPASLQLSMDSFMAFQLAVGMYEEDHIYNWESLTDANAYWDYKEKYMDWRRGLKQKRDQAEYANSDDFDALDQQYKASSLFLRAINTFGIFSGFRQRGQRSRITLDRDYWGYETLDHSPLQVEQSSLLSFNGIRMQSFIEKGKSYLNAVQYSEFDRFSELEPRISEYVAELEAAGFDVGLIPRNHYVDS
jgi:hypothetical protein